MRIKYLQNVNTESLPIYIKEKFNKIKSLYVLQNSGLTYNLEELHYPIHKETFKRLYDLFENEQLFTTLHPNIIHDDKKNIVKHGFEEVKNNKSSDIKYYKFKREEYLTWYIEDNYQRGFLNGYNETFKIDDSLKLTDETTLKIQSNFNNIYYKCDESVERIKRLFDENFDESVLCSLYVYRFGEEEGRFIKSWDIILNNRAVFEKIFEKQKNTLNKSIIDWKGTQTEFIELVKALIESNTLAGKQKNIIEDLSIIFNIQIKNPDKLIQDIKNRNNGSETLFIDKLKSNLYNFITKEKTR